MTFTCVRSEGGFMPSEILDAIARGEIQGQRAEDFGFPQGRRLADEIAYAWSAANNYWSAFKTMAERLPEQDPGTSLTRTRWMIPFLGLLDYQVSYQGSIQVGGQTFPISHVAGNGVKDLPVHIEGFRTDLGQRPQGGRLRMSPHALLQEYLNRSEHVLWGMVTNGKQLRLLRQSPVTSRPSYLEFDLESMMENAKFSEFAMLYRVCHRTRLVTGPDDSGPCLLERYFQTGVDQGGRVRDRLRDGVEQALIRFGNGLLRHPGSQALRDRCKTPSYATKLYPQLLRLVYRLLFLMVAEERHMVFPDDPQTVQRESIYRECYSISRLRDLAERPVSHGDFCDIWLGLLTTFSLFSSGEPVNALGVPPLNGELFGEGAMPDLGTARISNADFIEAFRNLSLFTDSGRLQRVNYAALDVEELGSVYESLLDYYPVIVERGGEMSFELLTGSERKSTGSYYTPKELVSELIESALVPVMQEKMSKAKTPQDKEKAILSMAICDPAAGSGHFLLAAARRMGRELARIRWNEDEPSPEHFRAAVREVISHCVYAVDLNPLAVDLCKLALWIESHNPGKPLSFLDHRVRCGNSIVGVFTLDVLNKGIPDAAFAPVSGDDRQVAAECRRANAIERNQFVLGQLRLGLVPESDYRTLARRREELNVIGDDSVSAVRDKERRLHEIRNTAARLFRAADAWAAPFFVMYRDGPVAITNLDLFHILNSWDVDEFKVGLVERTARRERFFHWPLEFPEVFERGGFDVVLGNPPWERIKLQEKEFFASRDPEIAGARNRAERELLIRDLESSNPALYDEFVIAKHSAECSSKFMRGSGRFPLGSAGDINTYAVFAELCKNLINEEGCAGIIVPTGIATDHTCRRLFGQLVSEGAIVSLCDFENRQGLFPAVDSRQRFSLLTISGKAQDTASFAFFLLETQHLRDERRRVRLSESDFRLFNPNTLTCPLFRTNFDFELARKVYERVPVLINEKTGWNPWGIRFMTVFHMSNDSRLFRTRGQLEEEGLLLHGNKFFGKARWWLPLYEGKMIHRFDHRWGTYEGDRIRDCTDDEKRDPCFAPLPRYWVSEDVVEERLSRFGERRWLIGFRDITNATNEVTSIFSFLPRTAVGNKVPLIFLDESCARLSPCFLANVNSLVFDYVVRQKLGGTTLNFFYLEQVPILAPDAYAESDVEFITSRVLELTYTSEDMRPFAEDMGYSVDPFPWDPERRAVLKAELDAYYAHLYGLSREELRYILDPKEVMGDDFPGETFRVLKENEIRMYGEYRTRRLVLEAYDRIGSMFGKTYEVRSQDTRGIKAADKPKDGYGGGRGGRVRP